MPLASAATDGFATLLTPANVQVALALEEAANPVANDNSATQRELSFFIDDPFGSTAPNLQSRELPKAKMVPGEKSQSIQSLRIFLNRNKIYCKYPRQKCYI